MLNRIRQEELVFQHPFTLRGWKQPHPAGRYAVEIEEELVEGLSFEAWRRVSTMLTLLPLRPGGTIEALPVDAGALAAALLADNA